MTGPGTAGEGPPEPVQYDVLAERYEAMAGDCLQPLWTITADLLTPTPRPRTLPWLWPGRQLRAHALACAELVPVGRGGERRAISLVNPGLEGKPYATATLWGALQCLGSGESAPAHRHSPGAIRFVLEGEGVWTTVDGDPCDMAPGDLVLTPSWTWHDHHNPGEDAMLWFDGLDLPVVEALEAVFFESYHELTQPSPATHNASLVHASPAALASGRAAGRGDGTASPLLVYRWADTDAALSGLLNAGLGDATVEFANPRTGASALPTAACSMRRLRPGSRTATTRVTGSSISVVFSGRGRTHVGDRCFEWEQGDMFVVPSWASCSHEADITADLFVFSDRPVLEALGLWREEILAEGGC